jgi:hypothetical protein
MLIRVEYRDNSYRLFNLQTVPRVGELILRSGCKLFNEVTEVIHIAHDAGDSEIIVRVRPV